MSKQTMQLTARQIRGLNKIGDAYFPGDDAFPSFSVLGCVESAPAAIEELPDDDRGSLLALLSVMGIAPSALVRGVVALAERGPRMGGPVGMLLRFLRLGLKGVVTSLYYSGERGANYAGPTPLDVIGYSVSVHTADVDERERQATPDDYGSVSACRGLEPSSRY